MPKVIRMELKAKNVERASRFYHEVFGWSIDNWGGPFNSWMRTAGPGDPYGEPIGTMSPPDPRAAIAIDVSSVDECMERIMIAGGKISSRKAVIPNVGFHVYCEDTEGNIFGIMEYDPAAALEAEHRIKTSQRVATG